MKPLVDEISQTKTFLEFSSVRNSFIDCFVCNSKKCLGFCKIKPSEKPLQRFLQHNKKIFVRIEIIKAEENFYLDDKLVEFKKVQKNQSLSLSDCLQNFSHPETLEKSEAWACDKCKNKGSAQKMIELSIIPRILIIHLKRFRINKQNREKINARVKFPKTELRLDEFVSGSIRSSYDLFAVCNHMGGLYGGHYTANVYSTRGSRWFECNDSQITESDEISESSSYVLFYRSKDNLKS
jgi:ubiquitin carboxyl-terminal hydrolase 4/11/15